VKTKVMVYLLSYIINT